MKRHFIHILTLLAIATLTACDSYLINGPLDGMWQLQTIERTAPDTLITNAGDLSTRSSATPCSWATTTTPTNSPAS